MWKRSELKAKAWTSLKGGYWQAFLVTLIVSIVASFGDYSGGKNSGMNMPEFFSGLMMFAGLAAIAVRIFLGIPLSIGGNRYFIQAAQGRKDFNELGFAFHRERYQGVLKGMLWMTLRIILWTLLLIIPGIIKSIAYVFVPFLLADNPGLGAKRALALSEQMTRGHKGGIFLFGLSFIGWILLGFIGLFVGVFFVLPYIQAAFAELYLNFRNRAVEKGFCTKEEVGLV